MKRIATNPIRNFAARLVPAVGYGTRNAGRLLLALGFTAALTSLASCTDTDDDDLSAFRPGAATSLSVSALPGYSADNATPDANTRAFDPTAPIGVIDHGKTAWEEGDSLAMRITFNESENTSSPFGTAYAYATYNSGAWTLGDGLTTVTNSSKENLCFAVRGGKVLWPARAKSITVDANGELCATRPENTGRGERWVASTTLNTPNAAIALSGWEAECIRLRVAAAPGDVVKITAPGFVPTGSLMGTALGTDESLTATADKQGNACFYGYTSPNTGAVTLTVSLANSYAYGSTVIPVFKNTREFAPSDVVGAGRSYAINALADTELDGVTDWDGFVPGKSTYYGTLAGLDASKDMWIITDAESDYTVLKTKLNEVAAAHPERRINLSLPKATGVGGSAFYGCKSLTTVSLPAATYVGNNAFYDCTSLATLTFGKPITGWGISVLGDNNNIASNVTLTLAAGQVVMMGISSFWPTETPFTDFGMGKVFCGAPSADGSGIPYTFKEIKKHW